MTESQEVFYANERDWLLGQAALGSSSSFAVPADGLRAVFEVLGYKVVSRWGLPDKVMGFSDFELRQVVMARDLAQRLDFPESAPGVLRSCLAHELGHIRLHAERALKGMVRKSWEREANEFAMVFLMPRAQVLARPEVALLQSGQAQDQESLWRLVGELARPFQVTPSFMARSLVAYGVIKLNRKTRKIRPVVRLMRMVSTLAA